MPRKMRPACAAAPGPVDAQPRQLPPVSFGQHAPDVAFAARHSKPSGHESPTFGTHDCEHFISSSPARPMHMPVRQNCGYVHVAPSSPAAGSQKHLPASHFMPLRPVVSQSAAVLHAPPFVIVTIGVRVSTPISSFAMISTSMTLFGSSLGIGIMYGDFGCSFALNGTPFFSPHL